MGWDRQINGDGDTLADAAVSRLDDLDDRLARLVDVLERIAVVAEKWAEPLMFVEPPQMTEPPTWVLREVPVINGIATLPDGTEVKSMSDVVRVPVLA